MAAKTRNISTLIESQLPGFIVEDYTMMKTFIEKYYEQQELRGQPLDIINNITQYRNIDFYDKNILKEKTQLSTAALSSDTTITVENATSFPEKNGYIKINDEILFYKERTNTQFLEVSRGVSGNNTLGDLYTKSEFVTTEAADHRVESDVLNISNLFLYAFVKNFENEYLGAFPEKFLRGEIDKRALIKNITDFYKAKGTDRSIKFLFNTIISRDPKEEVNVYAPKDLTLKASTSDWVSEYSIRVVVLSGNLKDLVGLKIEQGSNSAIVDNVDGNRLVLAPETIVGEFDISSKTKLRRDVTPSATKGDKITVFSTQGFPQEGDLIIGNTRFTYTKKSVNQFTIDTRESSNVIYNYNEDVYSGNVVSSGNVEFLIEGVVFNLLPSNPQPYATTGDSIVQSTGGFDTVSPIIKNVANDVRWFINTDYTEPSSIHAGIEVPNAISDVSAVFEDEQYFYICSSSFPAHTDILDSSVTVPLQDQELLKLIRKEPITTTEIYSTGNKDIGILVDGSPVYSNKSEEEIVYGNIETVKVLNKGRNYKVAPVVLVNEEPNKATAVLSGETVNSITVNDTSLYESDPDIRITSGEGARLRAIVTNGEITSILIDDPGEYYTSPPTILITDITGRGSFAEYEAIISNGEIVECVKINGGKLYDTKFTSVVAIPAGTGAKAEAKVRRWVKDRYNLLSAKLDTNNSYVFESDFGRGYGYGVVANPVVLRRRLEDSITAVYEETGGLSHSPILGYAYDGNPIYGPYGHADPLDRFSSIVRLNSGYVLKSSRPNGPSIIENTLGTFVDDYEWVPTINSGKTELDANNGRFCVTPDYPEGVYAYFLTIDADNTPVFPYVLGDNFYSIPVDSNYNTPISQRDLPKQVKRLDVLDFDLSGKGFVGKIKDVSPGRVKSVSVASSVDTFEVGSSIVTENNLVSGSVSSLKGKNVLSIESKETNAVEITTLNTVYLFAGDTINQQSGASGEIVTNTINGNNFILRNVNGDFIPNEIIESSTEVQKFIIDIAANYSLGSTVQLIDTENQSIVATAEVLESVVSQNSLTVKILSGTFEVGSDYYLKSTALEDTSRSEIIDIVDLSKNIEILSVNESIAILETDEDHGVSVGDFVEIDINPDPTTTETTYFTRKKIYQNFETVPVTHESTIVDTGIGSGDVLTTGVSYIAGTYFDVELIFRDQTQVRDGVGKPGDPNNARATIVVSGDGGIGSVSSVTITSKGSGYRREDILTFTEGNPIPNVDPNNPQRFAFVVSHVGFGAENTNLYLSTLANLSNGDFLKVGQEIVEITGVNIAFGFVSVNRGRKGTTPLNHFNGSSVVGEEIPFRISEGYTPLGTGALRPIVKSYDEVTGKIVISYDYGDDINSITKIIDNTVFFDESSPKKVVTLTNVEEAAYKLELSKNNEDNFEVNPTFDVQRFYTYKFDTSHFSMIDTFIDISPSINYNILVDGKEVSSVVPGSVGSFTKIRFGFAPDVDPVNDPERVELRYSTFYYFIKAFGVDTENAQINIIPDPLTGKKKVTHKTNTKFVYQLDSEIEYDGSGDISYTTTALNASGEINSISITNSSRNLLSIPVLFGVYPKKQNLAELTPVIEDGKVKAILVVNSGEDYVKPELIFNGDGRGAKFKISQANGKIANVVVLSQGSGYTTGEATVVETDVNAYLESDNIGLPKNVQIVLSGNKFTDDYSTTPSFTGSTVLILEDADLFKPTVEIVQSATGAKGNPDLGYWKPGSNVLKVNNVTGTFVVGESIESPINQTSAIVKNVLTTDFLEDVKSYTQTGAFASSKGSLGVERNKIQDSYFYQDYSYVIESETSIEDWRDLILETTHPAGFEVFGEVNIFSDGMVPMPEAAQKPVETYVALSVSIRAIDTVTTSRQITTSIARFKDLNIRRGAGAISISDVDLAATFFKDIRLEPEFDGDIDPDTGKRIGTTTFTMYEVNTTTGISAFNDQQVLVTLDGIIQEPGVSYTTFGNQIEFLEPPLGPRIAEGQEVNPQKFYGKSLRYIDNVLNNQYLRKFQDISDQFDNIRNDFDLYYDDGSIAKTEENELLIVVIDGIKQRYGEAYEITRFEDPNTPDKIVFKSKPEVEDPLYDSEDSREDSVLRNGQNCYIYSIGNYFTASITKSLVARKPRGPFLIKNSLTNQVVNVADPIYAIVFVENVLQIPEKSYKIGGSTISFNADLPFHLNDDGVLTPPAIEIIYAYGKTTTPTLTAHNLERDVYLRQIQLELTGTVAGDEFIRWDSSTRQPSDLGDTAGLFVADPGELESYEFSREFPVTSSGTGYPLGVAYTDIKFYNTATQSFLVGLDGSGDFLIDTVLMPTLQLSPGNTYRFNVSDPTLVGQQLSFNHTVDNSLIYVEYSGDPGTDGAFVDLIVSPEADLGFGLIEYQNTTSGVSVGTIDVVLGPVGQYGYGLLIEKLTFGPTGVVTAETRPSKYGENYVDGDVVTSLNFPGNYGTGNGDVEITISIVTREYEPEVGELTPLGIVKQVLFSNYGNIRLQVEATKNWDDITDKVFVVKKYYNSTKEVFKYTIRGVDPSVTITEPTDGAGTPLLERKSSWWLSGSVSDDAYYRRTKAFANLHPRDKIWIAGEDTYRQVLEISRLANKTNFNIDGYIANDQYLNIQTTPYNGEQRGQGLSVFAEIDGEGRVTDLVWNRIIWNEEYTRILDKTFYGYTAEPKLYFIPKTNAGGGAEAQVLFWGDVVSIDIINPGFGYELPPTVVVAKPYNVLPDPNRKIDSLSVIKFDLDVSLAELLKVNTFVTLTNSPTNVTVNESYIYVGVDNPIPFQAIIVQIPVEDVVTFESADFIESDFTTLITTSTEVIQVFDTKQNETLLIHIKELEEEVKVNDIDVEINYQYQMVSSDFFLRPVPQRSTTFAIISADFLVGDSILYVTNTDGFPEAGNLLVNFERVEYDSKEFDRFFISERGVRSVEADAFIGDLVQLEPDFSLATIDSDVNIIVSEFDPESGDRFDFFGDVSMPIGVTRREAIVRIEPDSAPVLVDLGDPRNDILGNQINAVVDLELQPQIEPGVSDVYWQILRYLDVLERTDLNDASISTERVEVWVQPEDSQVLMSGLTTISIDEEITPLVLELGLEKIEVEFQAGGVIVVPGIFNPIQVIAVFINDFSRTTLNPDVINLEGSVAAGYYEQFSFPLFIRFEDARKALIDLDIVQWTRTLEDDDVSFSFDDFGGVIASVEDEFIFRKRIWTEFDQLPDNTVTVTLPDNYLEITQIPVQIDPVEEIIRFTAERIAPFNVDIYQWTRTLPYEKAFDSVVTISTEDEFITVSRYEQQVLVDNIDSVIFSKVETEIDPSIIDIDSSVITIAQREVFVDSVITIDTEDEIISQIRYEQVVTVTQVENQTDRIIPIFTATDEEIDVRVLDTVLHDDVRVIQPQVLIGEGFTVLLALLKDGGFEGLPIIKTIESTFMVCGSEEHLEGVEITLILNPVEEILIQGVLTEVLGPEIVEVDSDLLVREMQVQTPDTSPEIVFLNGTPQYDVIKFVNLWSGGAEERSGEFPLDEFGNILTLGSPVVTIFDTFNQDRRGIEPLVFEDSVLSIIAEINLAGSKIKGQELFIAFDPETPVQGFLDGITVEFDTTKFVNLWSGGAEERSGEFPVDERGFPFLQLATPFQGDELSAGNDLLERILQPQIFPGVLDVKQQFFRTYPNQHFKLDNPTELDDSPEEGLYASVSMPTNVTVEVFFTETVPGGSDNQPTQAPPQEIEPRDATIQTVGIQLTREIEEIELNVQGTIFQEIVITPPESIGTFIGGSVIGVSLNLDSIPDEGSGEDPPIFVDVTVVAAFEPQNIILNIVRDIDTIELDVQATIFQEYIRRSEAGSGSTYGTTDDLALRDSTTQSITSVETELDVKQPVAVEETRRIIQSIVNGIADSIADELDSIYLRTTLGPNYKQYEENAFISNGTLNINASINETLSNFQILEFERGESSTRPNGSVFNLAIPSINEIGGTLASDLLNTEVTSISINSTVPLDQMDWPSAGVILIGDTATGTLEQIEYTGISGTTLTGITRGSNPQTHLAATSYIRTIG